MGRKQDEMTPASLQFSKFLADIFHSGRDGADTFTGTYRGHGIPPFCLDELHHCLTGMRANKGGDGEEFVLEMFRFGNCGLHQAPLRVFNSMLFTRTFHSNWQHTMFNMFPKSGTLANVNNWRPVAALRITSNYYFKKLQINVLPFDEFVGQSSIL